MSEAGDQAFFESLETHRGRMFVRLMRRLPSDPRCAICRAPYGGVGGRLMGRLGPHALQGAAAGGEIVMSSRVHDRAGEHAAGAEPRELALKGKSEPEVAMVRRIDLAAPRSRA